MLRNNATSSPELMLVLKIVFWIVCCLGLVDSSRISDDRQQKQALLSKFIKSFSRENGATRILMPITEDNDSHTFAHDLTTDFAQEAWENDRRSF